MFNRMVFGAVVFAMSGVALGQGYSTGFEPPDFIGTPGGTQLTAGVAGGGQDGWYNPLGGSLDYLVFTYVGNSYSFVPNPSPPAATQFVAGRSSGSSVARAQRNEAFGGGEWTVSWDVAVRYDGVLPSAPNLGSFSLQPLPGSRSWQTLFNWFNVATASSWRCTFIVYDSVGAEISPPLGVLPSAAWGGLLPNTWYRMSATWSFADNKVSEVSITNLATGATTVDHPTDWYLGGGASPGPIMPTAYRLFTGGANGNMVAWDNFSIGQGCYADCNADGSLTVADFGCFQTEFVATTVYADCNADGAWTVADFGCFQTAFVTGCP